MISGTDSFNVAQNYFKLDTQGARIVFTISKTKNGMRTNIDTQLNELKQIKIVSFVDEKESSSRLAVGDRLCRLLSLLRNQV